METALLRFCVSFSGNPHHKKIAAAHHRASCEIPGGSSEDEWSAKVLSRRSVLATVSGLSLVSSTSLAFPGEGLAVVKQGLLAGRVPGLSEPDDEGSCLSLSLFCLYMFQNATERKIKYSNLCKIAI